MRTKRLMALVPASFLLCATVQFFRPKGDILEKVGNSNVDVRFVDVNLKLVERVVNHKRRINLHSLKDRLARKRMELYSNSDWSSKLSTFGSDNHWRQGNPTIVTVLMDIGRGSWDLYRRPYHLYQNFMKPLLALDVYLYVYCDTDGAEFVKKHRQNFLHKTVIKILSLADLPYYKYFPKIKRIIEHEQVHWNNEWEPAMKKHPESFSAEYNLLMNSKTHFLREASSRNPFGSEHFFWLDAGYGHGQTKYPYAGAAWSPKTIIMNTSLHEKVSFMKLRNVNLTGITLKQLYRKDVALVVGSFFGGTMVSVQRFHDIYDSMFLSLLKENYVDDDQTLIVLCYQSHPELFNMVEGDWYDVFLLFN